MDNAINISKYKNYPLNFKSGVEKTSRTLLEKGKIVFVKYLQEHASRL